MDDIAGEAGGGCATQEWKERRVAAVSGLLQRERGNSGRERCEHSSPFECPPPSCAIPRVSAAGTRVAGVLFFCQQRRLNHIFVSSGRSLKVQHNCAVHHEGFQLCTADDAVVNATCCLLPCVGGTSAAREISSRLFLVRHDARADSYCL